MISPAFPEQLKLATYAALSETLELEQALQRTLVTLQSVLPADGAFVNYFMRDELAVQFLAHARADRAEKFTVRVPVPFSWHQDMSYENRAPCLLVNSLDEDPVSRAVLQEALPQVKSFVMLRLLMDGTHFGVACFYSEKEHVFTDAHAAIIASLHNPLAINVGYSLAMRFRRTGAELNAENKRLQRTIAETSEAPLLSLLKHTPSFVSIADHIRRAAPFDVTVMLTGESGCGKEVVATTIQQLSKRRLAPFVKVNCAALSASLIESELFGYEDGAFTGAHRRHAGLFEQADRGTLFLDEVGELPPDIQSKLLRVIQGQTFRRVGGDKEIRVDVRIICATNRDLAAMVREKRFREDLYYRLNVFPIEIAPLRERPEDIDPLASHFLSLAARRYGLAMVPQLSEEARREAKAWPWPGNVRELRNVMTRAVLSGEPVVRRLDLNAAQTDDYQPVRPSREGRSEQIAPDAPEALPQFDDMQRAYFFKILRAAGGKISGPGGAAERTGIHPNTLRSRLKKLGLPIEK